MKTLQESLTYVPVELTFGTSGLRGLAVDMTDLECYINTRGFLQFLANSEGLQRGATIYLAGDLRESTPRILSVVQAAVLKEGYELVYLGLIPTPALALHALRHQSPGVMVSGSHIPADRNGIKFYKSGGEVLKEDEAAIKASVEKMRASVYNQEFVSGEFDERGQIRKPIPLPAPDLSGGQAFLERYLTIFGQQPLAGKRVVFYQHSAVARDLLAELLEKLGAEVIRVGRSDVFIPIDSENVTQKDHAYFHELAETNSGLFAIVSADGDSDRPFVVDEMGTFHRGDVLGAVVATWLGADFAAYPVSASDATDAYLRDHGIDYQHTRIGSPYVVSAMETARGDGKRKPVAWEVNGGFLTGAEFLVGDKPLAALPTRDAILPIVVALVAAVDADKKISELFRDFLPRFTSAGLIDNFPTEVSKAMVAKFADDTPEVRQELARYFTPEQGFGAIESINTLDGIRVFFAGGDIAHLRPSGNAPQLRIYSVANTQERADEIVTLALAEPDGIFRRLEKAIAV